MDSLKQINFKNWTLKDFTYNYAGEPHTFEAGGVYPMSADIAVHFAQHLAERELFASGNSMDEALPESKMKEMIDKCFPGGSVDGLIEPLHFTKIEDKPLEEAPEKVLDNKVLIKATRAKKIAKSKTKDSEYTK